ncbi:uncharacterized protein EMH_0092150 [Eimeria mitis]|uniref:Uncharacterized protein n=1 Tax=Eimeria mitis TaxID=44415 RepID=U6KME7_9EIME|nr:uncharacterized protein EMH_0092150 [Eimeria mitis]CDJ36628.1 hypothetical protein, conserved [Eimeria mitis]
MGTVVGICVGVLRVLQGSCTRHRGNLMTAAGHAVRACVVMVRGRLAQRRMGAEVAPKGCGLHRRTVLTVQPEVRIASYRKCERVRRACVQLLALMGIAGLPTASCAQKFQKSRSWSQGLQQRWQAECAGWVDGLSGKPPQYGSACPCAFAIASTPNKQAGEGVPLATAERRPVAEMCFCIRPVVEGEQQGEGLPLAAAGCGAVVEICFREREVAATLQCAGAGATV